MKLTFRGLAFLIRSDQELQKMFNSYLEPLWNKHYTRLLVACFWIIGLCNNFAYVVMLSAAHDILSDGTHQQNNTSNESSNTENNSTNKYDCNDLSTGTILLADIIPGILIKLIAPFFVHRIKYHYRVCVCVCASAASFLLVALSPSNLKFLTFTGVVCASISSSFGEITFLSLSTLYNSQYALLGWGSGTGAAGVGGSLGYAGLTSAGLSPRTTILIMTFIPVLMILSFILLPSYKKRADYENIDKQVDASSEETKDDSLKTIGLDIVKLTPPRLSMEILKPLLKYMIPLFLVYYSEYFINQGLFELLFFKDSTLIRDHKNQYRWYNVCYQIAVFISRSSIGFFQIKFLPIFPILQIINVILLLTHIFHGYLHSIYVVFLIIFWEGLLGGGCYVNAFHLVSIEVPAHLREFSIAITSVADSFGIALSGFTSIPTHNAICNYGRR